MYIIYRVYKKGDYYYNNEIIAQDVIEVKEKEDLQLNLFDTNENEENIW